ncbi:MAG: Tol-Pal system beta propeller repeat protein TolB [Methylococcaceae bacterium]|nr:Tol-Pal system beta propeller repeat protein TolB [Methylococcaceae bacterium]
MACVCGGVSAQLTIEITGGHEAAVPIAIVPFTVSNGIGDAAAEVDRIVKADLERSGRFRALPERELLSRPSQRADVDFRTWQSLGQEYLVIGRARLVGPDQYSIEFNLFDTLRKEQIVEYGIPGSRIGLRRVAHRIADIIYEKITGQPGAFSSRIAYITDTVRADNSREFKLQVSDADGYNPQTILTSREPIMSPAWSPDGSKIAYVSFEKKVSAIFVQTVATGNREQVAANPGINGAPSWSPDGSQLALTLSRDGDPEIYILNLASRSLERLTRSISIDTEPVWFPDGNNILFTSDRGGSPQLYSIGLRDGRIRRLTFEGNYNAAATISPDGRLVAMVHGSAGRYHIAVLELATGNLNVLTDGGGDESPSFAPNGSMILYATRRANREQLSAISVDGQFRQQLGTIAGGVREPAWSPEN